MKKYLEIQNKFFRHLLMVLNKSIDLYLIITLQKC